ncbi:MAG TPA: histidine utilization repressor [Candidimonas sp.]|nr:histidine utilization repressor [Candidimonas sp.]
MRNTPSALISEAPETLPVYQQIKNYVLDQIQSGAWQEGDLIPTELALCETFKVSRMTVNRALRELTNDQLLVRYKGSGTYVAQPKFQSTLIEIRSIAQDIRERGHRHSSRVISLNTLSATETQAKRFQIAPKTTLFHSVIVHYENEVPIQIEDRVVDAAVAPDYLDQDWQRMTPNEYLMRVAPLPTGQYTIEVRLPTKDIAEPLDIPLSQPCLVMDRITFSNHVFTSHATMWHPGNRYKFAGKI